MSDLRIGIIESNEQVRLGRAMVFNSQVDMRVVLEESDGNSAIDRVPNYLVDVLVTGTNQHGFRGGQFVRKLSEALAAASNDCAVIATSPFSTPKLRWESLLAGAQEHIGLDASASDLLALTRKVVKQDFLVDLADLKSQSVEFGGLPPVHQLELKLSELNEVQNNIVKSFLNGLGDQAIAKQHDLARTRVTQLIESLLKVSGFTSRNQLAILLLGMGN